MASVDISEVELVRLVTHQVGNKSEEEGIRLSDQTSSFGEDTLEYLVKYFLSSFKPEEFYQFDHSVDLEMNEVFTLAKDIFSGNGDFITHSQNIAKLLYDHSTHPMIKSGACNIGYFNQIALDGSDTKAIGIFKSETDAPFLKMTPTDHNFLIQHDFGFEMKGIDKGCLIFNTDAESGYRILIIDKTNKSNDAQYWCRDFLQIKPCSDNFHHTKEFLTITKNFVTDQLSEEFELSKTDKIDLMNRSMEYFKTNESFDKEDFQNKVFQDEEVIDSFRKFDNNFRQNNNLDVADSFAISAQAVKRQARVFKSVLKLDKNFHVYIHGDKSLIERGVESDGRKYYKIYYNQEQ